MARWIWLRLVVILAKAPLVNVGARACLLAAAAASLWFAVKALVKAPGAAKARACLSAVASAVTMRRRVASAETARNGEQFAGVRLSDNIDVVKAPFFCFGDD